MRFEETLGISHDLTHLVHEMRLGINGALAPLGLTTPKYAALSVLEARGTATNAELARECAVTAQTMNRIMKDLETAGFVQRVNDGSSGLKQPFVMTEKALSAVCSAHVAVNGLELAMVKEWSADEIDMLRRLVARCHENLGRFGGASDSAEE